MPQRLSLSRAARLAGVSRGELQAQIRQQNIPTFEGQIAVDDLVATYPEIDLNSDPVLERLARIKARARPKSRYTDHWMPEPEVLMARLEDFQHVLTRTKAALNTMEDVLTEVTERLEEAAAADEGTLRATAQTLGRQLREAITKAQSRVDRKAELFARDAMLRFVAVSARVLPSGHEFFVEGRDSLLEAALKAGLHLDYGCASGNCGACKVRVRDGRVRQIRHHDYVLSRQEREHGYCLACCNTAVSDVLLEANEALGPTDLPQQQIRCIVRKLEPVSETLQLVHVQTPRTQTLRFMAGQSLTVTLEDGSQRRLAVASCPCDGRNLQFLVWRRPGDGFVGALLAGRDRQTIQIEGPHGDISLAEESIDPAVFVAVEDGLAPIKSLVEHAIAIDTAPLLRLFRVDALPPGSLLGNLCRAWEDALDNFVYHRLDPQATPVAVLDRIADLGDLGGIQLYVAAPRDWLTDFLAQARARGITQQALHGIAVDGG